MTSESTANRDEARQTLIDYRTDVTARISEICRFIGLGLIAVFYTMKTGSLDDHFEWFRMSLLYFVGVAGVLAILLDYAQYVNNHRSVEGALGRPTLDYDQDAFPYRAAKFCFRWKQRITAAGAIALILLVLLT